MNATLRTILIDHSRLRRAASGDYQDEIRRLRALVEGGRVIFVSSFVHLYEIARHGDVAANRAEAELIDSLHPKWLRMRLQLLNDEFVNEFHRMEGRAESVKPVAPLLVSPGQYVEDGIALLHPGQGTAVGAVEHIVKKPGILDPVARSIADHPYLPILGDLKTAYDADPKKFSDVVETGARILVDRLAPIRRADGSFTTIAERKKFAEELVLRHVPTLAIELELLKYRVRRNFTPEESEQIDLQVAEAALHYVDAVVLDNQFRDLVAQAKRSCDYIRAEPFSRLRDAVEHLERG